MKNRGIYFFSNDLRLSDNPLLIQATKEVDELLCLYIDDSLLALVKHKPEPLSPKRMAFKEASLATLDRELGTLGQMLWRTQDCQLSDIYHLINHLKIDKAYISRQVGWYEQLIMQNIADASPGLKWRVGNNHTLFAEQELPFELSNLPISFTGFRKKVEPINARIAQAKAAYLPKPCYFQSEKLLFQKN